ncbi:extracellular solute-binding protein [Neorhizobium galegae]|uniref:extracellular solute-binding protein n=1 Tax=Neorhizobium galegae TaxID=399 RepID=UPI00351CF546
MKYCAQHEAVSGSKPAPKRWADFFDLKAFPGPRSMQRQPYILLESALLADGVSPEKLYPLDVDRVFKNLDQIKSSVSVWWTTGAQAVDVLASGECTMGVAWDSRIAPAKASGQPVDNVFNGGLLVLVLREERAKPHRGILWRCQEPSLAPPACGTRVSVWPALRYPG